jgi:hypothetical protein
MDQTARKSTAEKVNGFLVGWQETTKILELTLIDNISATVPWMAPVIPAYLAYNNMLTVLHFNQVIAVVGAVVIEFLGQSSVTTAFQFWDYNDARKQAQIQRRKAGRPSKSKQVDRKRARGLAPVGVAGGASLFYLVIVILVNVILDTAPAMQRVAKALLSLLGIVAAVILAIRSQHTRRRMDQQAASLRRKVAGTQKNTGREAAGGMVPEKAGPGNPPEVAGKSPVTVPDWRKLSRAEKIKVAGMNTAEIEAAYGVSDRLARMWKGYASSNGFH